jgi:hypothetical protein
VKPPQAAELPGMQISGAGAMAKTSNTTEDAVASVTETVAQLQKMGLNSMSWMGTDWVERMSDIGSEALKFLSDRIEQDVALQHRLLHCRDMKELHAAQAEFLQNAIEQYTSETGKMVELTTELFTPPKEPK